MVSHSVSRGHQKIGSAPGCLVIVVAQCRAHSNLASMSLVDSPASINLARTSPAVNEPLTQDAVSTNGPRKGGLVKASGILRRPVTLGGSLETMINRSPSVPRPQRTMKPSDAIAWVQNGDAFEAAADISLPCFHDWRLPARSFARKRPQPKGVSHKFIGAGTCRTRGARWRAIVRRRRPDRPHQR
jgi:hypothetical protein